MNGRNLGWSVHLHSISFPNCNTIVPISQLSHHCPNFPIFTPLCQFFNCHMCTFISQLSHHCPNFPIVTLSFPSCNTTVPITQLSQNYPNFPIVTLHFTIITLLSNPVKSRFRDTLQLLYTRSPHWGWQRETKAESLFVYDL